MCSMCDTLVCGGIKVSGSCVGPPDPDGSTYWGDGVSITSPIWSPHAVSHVQGTRIVGFGTRNGSMHKGDRSSDNEHTGSADGGSGRLILIVNWKDTNIIIEPLF